MPSFLHGSTISDPFSTICLAETLRTDQAYNAPATIRSTAIDATAKIFFGSVFILKVGRLVFAYQTRPDQSSQGSAPC